MSGKCLIGRICRGCTGGKKKLEEKVSDTVKSIYSYYKVGAAPLF